MNSMQDRIDASETGIFNTVFHKFKHQSDALLCSMAWLLKDAVSSCDASGFTRKNTVANPFIFTAIAYYKKPATIL